MALDEWSWPHSCCTGPSPEKLHLLFLFSKPPGEIHLFQTQWHRNHTLEPCSVAIANGRATGQNQTQKVQGLLQWHSPCLLVAGAQARARVYLKFCCSEDVTPASKATLMSMESPPILTGYLSLLFWGWCPFLHSPSLGHLHLRLLDVLEKKYFCCNPHS